MEIKAPYNEVHYFDRFIVGESILSLHFFEERQERLEPIADSAKVKRACVKPSRPLGVYQGHDEVSVRLQVNGGEDGVAETVTVQAVKIRGLKEWTIEKLDEIREEVFAALTITSADMPQPIAFVTFTNALREVIVRNSVLIPDAPVPAEVPMVVAEDC